MWRRVTSAYKNSFTGLSRETWLLSIVMLINRSGTMAVPFMSLYVTQYLHRKPSDAGIIIALFGAGSILGATAGGKLTDMIGFRPVQIFSSIIGGILFITYSTITHFETLCVLTVVISFVAEAFRPANFVAIAAYSAPHLQTRSYSLNRFAINLGWAIGGSLGGFIAAIDYRLLFIVDGCVSVIAGICIAWWLPSVKAYQKTIQEKLKNITIRKPWQDRLFIEFILLTTVFVICFFPMFRIVPLFLKEKWHVEESMIGIILGLNGAIVAVFEMVMINKLEKKHTPFYYIIKGVLLTATAYALLMLPEWQPAIIGILSMVFITFGEMLALPFINTFVMSRTNEFNRGQYAAGYMLSWSVAQIVGPTGGFYIAEHTGYNWLWLILTAALLFCAGGFRLLQQRRNLVD